MDSPVNNGGAPNRTRLDANINYAVLTSAKAEAKADDVLAYKTPAQVPQCLKPSVDGAADEDFLAMVFKAGDATADLKTFALTPIGNDPFAWNQGTNANVELVRYTGAVAQNIVATFPNGAHSISPTAVLGMATTLNHTMGPNDSLMLRITKLGAGVTLPPVAGLLEVGPLT